MPSLADRKNIRKQVMNLFYKGVDLGFVKPDSLKVKINGVIQTAEVDQIAATVAKAVLNGFAPEVEVTLMRTDNDFIGGVLLQGMVGYMAGTNGPKYGFGNPEIDMDLIAGELLLVPKNNPPGTRTNSIRVALAYPSPDTLELAMGKNNFQELPLKFIVLPDLEADLFFQMMEMGNIDAEGLAPLGVFIQTSNPFRTGARSLRTMGLTKFEKQLLQAYRFDGAPSGVTALLNGAVTAGASTLSYDTASQNNPFVVGQTLRIITGGTPEFYEVTAVNPATPTSGTLTVVPGAFGSGEIAHNDNDTIEILKNVFRVNFTQQAIWATTDATRVAVGNVPGDLGDNRKGLVRHGGTAGAADITATVQGVQSPLLTITAA